MAEEKRQDAEDNEVQEILSDLDDILSDLGGGPTPAVEALAAALGNPSADVAPSPPPTPKAAVECPKPVPIQPPAAAVAPKPAAGAAPSPGGMSLELGSRPVSAKAPAPAAALAKPVPAQPPAAAPKPEVPGPAPAPNLKGGCLSPDPIAEAQMPEKVSKDQIRRVAFCYLRKFEAERDAFVKLLDQTAQTVSKKPLFLRWVLYQPAMEACDIKEMVARVIKAQAVSVLGILEGISETKLRELGEAFTSAGVMFRTIAPLDAGKKSLAVDIIVDMMLLPHE